MRWRLILKRAMAYVVDVLLLFFILMPLGFIVESILGVFPQTPREVWVATLLNFSIPAWLYFVLSDGSRAGATIGKRLLKIQVGLLGGGRLGLGRALARTAFKLLPWELAHVFGFALAGEGGVGDASQMIGLIAANVLAIIYLVIAVATGGRRSLHDYAVATEVRENRMV
jgi:uncharacterized RDD family membrane protein YckC